MEIFCSNSFPGTSVFPTPPLKSKQALKFTQLSRRTTVSACTTASTTYPSSLSMAASSSTLYEVLGIPATASCYEIKKAYRELARVFHPDVVAINQKDSSAAQFIKIHAAYSTLSDPDKRANYDRDLIFMNRRANLTSSMAENSRSRSSSRFSGYSCRNWETDQCW
ncbi:hypothetical protein Ancab_017380 [Ancistrocladus abbreviatus]